VDRPALTDEEVPSKPTSATASFGANTAASHPALLRIGQRGDAIALSVGGSSPVEIGVEVGVDPVSLVTEAIPAYQGKHAKPVVTFSVSLSGLAR
jgi:hypothetical protein